MNDWIEWLERQADWYDIVAKHAREIAEVVSVGDEHTRNMEYTRYACYDAIARDLRRKVMELKALHPCPTTT